jgi:hypothetical protein
MKKSTWVFPFFFFFTFTSFVFSSYKETKTRVGVDAAGFAVIELFTSEGCSSCPPADEAVADIVQEYKTNVYVLGFHVDYWNYLGWKDEFSAAAYGQRQSQYADVFGINSIYTPQVIINGKTQFTGSDKNLLHKTVEQELKNNQPFLIEISAKSSDFKNVFVAYKAGATDKAVLNIALVQLHATSVVKRGENEGKRLQHINVVRDFKTSSAGTGTTLLHIPAGLSIKDCKVIAFMQNSKDLHVTSATACIIQ